MKNKYIVAQKGDKCMAGDISKYLTNYKLENVDLLVNNDTCDRFDYFTAACCGAIGGLVDIFFVGEPGKGNLTQWSDDKINDVVKKFAKMAGWDPREEKRDNVASAIGFLEKKFKVNYDQRYSPDINNVFEMSTRNHHMKSLSHSPDIIGLFFSVLNQFTSTSSFVSEGQIITVTSGTFELEGSNYIAKLFCGVSNWLGHIMSDVAGSSGSVGNGGRGTGIVIPFYELFQFFQFGKFEVGKDRQDFATIAIRAYQEGYDFRYGIAMSVPVIITDLLIRFIWSLRQHYQHGKGLKECVPVQKQESLRVMLLFGNGTLCLMDGVDALLRSDGNFLLFFLRINIIGWVRFTSLVFKEICIQLGLAEALQSEVETYKRINIGLEFYLKELRRYDAEQYKWEMEKYINMKSSLLKVKTEEGLNQWLLESYKELDIPKPWQGEFDVYMGNSDNRLEFRL